MKAKSLTIVLSVVVYFSSITTTIVSAQSQSIDCDQCGCSTSCRKVCKLVAEDKTVEITCWGCEYEDFCIPGPSTPQCTHCECVDCSHVNAVDEKVCSTPKKFVWTKWLPSFAKIHRKKKLMKRTTTKTIPAYKWVVEEVCDGCEHRFESIDECIGCKLPPVPAEFSALPRVIELSDCFGSQMLADSDPM